eukprot:m.121357 g.121357  ORF g.121357 m.121357 type:complete len:207 (+) comp28847_c0_seq1:606-1226(+)
MGATGIMHLAGRFNCHDAVVFNPLIDLNRDTRWKFWLGGLRVPSKLRKLLPNIMADQFGSCGQCRLVYHVSKLSDADRQQCDIFQQHVTFPFKSNFDDFQTDESLPLLWTSTSDQTNPICSAAKHKTSSHMIVEHSCSKHVLPRELNYKSQWQPLLARIVTAASATDNPTKNQHHATYANGKFYIKSSRAESFCLHRPLIATNTYT